MKFENNILKGLTIGVRQTSGIMSVYPLIGEDLDIDMAKFRDINFVGNKDYGELRFVNNSDKPFILPTCHCIMTKQKAQDHSTTFATVLYKGLNKIENACCIQQTQCGFIDGEDFENNKETFSFLPLDIRKKVMFENKDKISKEMSFSRLWDNIITFQKELVGKHDGNLIYFYTKFLEDLSKFNAEFEIVDNQRGAIITFNDEIVGIEITPSSEYFSHIWQPLIRDCYGAAMIKMVKSNIKDSFSNSKNLDLSKCTTLKEVMYAIEEEYLNSQANVYLKLMQIGELEFENKTKEKDPIRKNAFIRDNSKFFEYRIMLDENKEYGTEFFVNNDEIIYLSLIKN